MIMAFAYPIRINVHRTVGVSTAAFPRRRPPATTSSNPLFMHVALGG
jgi:hypothetical protein